MRLIPSAPSCPRHLAGAVVGGRNKRLIQSATCADRSPAVVARHILLLWG